MAQNPTALPRPSVLPCNHAHALDGLHVTIKDGGSSATSIVAGDHSNVVVANGEGSITLGVGAMVRLGGGRGDHDQGSAAVVLGSSDILDAVGGRDGASVVLLEGGTIPRGAGAPAVSADLGEAGAECGGSVSGSISGFVGGYGINVVVIGDDSVDLGAGALAMLTGGEEALGGGGVSERAALGHGGGAADAISAFVAGGGVNVVVIGSGRVELGTDALAWLAGGGTLPVAADGQVVHGGHVDQPLEGRSDEANSGGGAAENGACGRWRLRRRPGRRGGSPPQ